MTGLPTYGYECTRCGEQFETFQRITEDALTTHEECGGELRRLLYPVGIVFKGPGFHVNDYTSTGRKVEKKAETAAEAKSESEPTVKSEPKTEPKSEPSAATTASD